MTSFSQKIDSLRPFDVLCLGRAGVDFYADKPGENFKDATSFNKFVGGSPANISAAIAKQSGRVSLISKVSTDCLGEYVCHYLNTIGVDTSGITRDDSGSRVSLAVLEVKPKDCDGIIYRNNAADLLLQPEDIDVSLIKQAKILLISGTALSASPSREAAFFAMQQARQVNTPIALDLDFRPYTWQSNREASIYYQLAASMSSILFGNDEEFTVLAGNETTDADTAEHCLSLGCDLVFFKFGDKGSKVFQKDTDVFEQPIFPVDCLKPYGAGDAYAGTILLALAQGKSVADAVKRGAAAAAINVSGLSCSEAMPTTEELDAFIAQHKTSEKHYG